MAKFVLTKRGGRKLIFNGFGYVKLNENKRIQWICEKKNSLKCKAYVTTAIDADDGDDAEMFGVHSHEGDPFRAEIAVAKNSLKRKAEDSKASTSAIVSEVVGGIPSLAAPGLPHIRSLQRRVRSYRSVGVPAVPATVSEFVIPDEYKVTVDGDDFLFSDDDFGEEGGRVIIYCTRRNLSILKSCEFWLADGTFSVAPKIFQQLYTIHGLVAGESLPMAYVLMTKKNENVYTYILNRIAGPFDMEEEEKILTGQEEPYAPNVFTTDFEMAMMNSVSRVFGGRTQIHGCFFHLCQSVQRKLGEPEFGLKELYSKNGIFRQHVKMICALSFVPTHCVLDYYMKLEDVYSKSADENVRAALPVLQYFGKNYVGFDSRKREKVIAKYPPAAWNNYLLTIDDGPRTNNAVEGWHNRFHRLVSGDKPTVWKLLDAIRAEQQYTERYYEVIISGKGKPKKAKYEKSDARLKQSVSMISSLPFDDYLRAISYHF